MREEENNNVSKNSWKRIFRKKWFFPSVYLMTAALLLTAVVWYQNAATDDQADPSEGTNVDSYDSGYDDNDAEPVMEQTENLNMPVQDQEQMVIKTKFYDVSASKEEKEQALILYNSSYHQSKGVSIAQENGESFDVNASASGTVTEIKEDPLFGNVVELTHEDDVTTKYMSLDDVQVEAGEVIQQGDLLGTAGQSLAGQETGMHVHFEVRKAGTAVDPETYFNQPLSELEAKEPKEEEESSVEPKEGEDEGPQEDDQPDERDQPGDEQTDPSNGEQAEHPMEDDGDDEGDATEEQQDMDSSISMMNA
ncbi:M23 family metallopeptidase [Pontibacillus litoralis]|uniref:M23ase beta-sheet core domain-containing protein n=1 Tax=Pontibacillus litoralis JSM 072002 TaxID=1385512 RepID=A0A0A5G5K2_9BACI|nr:M23 family metallopeptidase [Pontibacillus litoralis]KGX86433.1 hypothetical protein N784_04580 [Pontibacillus litoralis JSM 072002]